MINKIKILVKKNKILKSLYELLFNRPKINIFSAHHDKKVLFSYSTYHFKNKKYLGHSNYSESYIIAKIFDELGYNVDVVDNDKVCRLDLYSYDIFFGEGLPLYQAVTLNLDANIIYYATGSHPWQCSSASLSKLVNYYKSSNYLASESLRLQDYRWGIAASLSNSVICIGNEVTKKTFVDNGVDNIYLINPTFHAEASMSQINKTHRAMRSVLWFGSYGLLHKGLDTAIEAFRHMPDWTLHVCGKTLEEHNFINSLDISSNVVVHGFISIESDTFKELASNVGYVLLSSSSEGIATAVLTGMGRGKMIPLVSKECGIDVHDFGFLLENLEYTSIIKLLNKLNNQSIEELELNCVKAQHHAYQNFTIEQYELTMRSHLLACISNYEKSSS